MLPEGLCDIPKNDCEAETTLKTTGDIVFLSSAFASLEFPYNISMARVHVTAFTLANLVFNKFFLTSLPVRKLACWHLDHRNCRGKACHYHSKKERRKRYDIFVGETSLVTVCFLTFRSKNTTQLVNNSLTLSITGRGRSILIFMSFPARM